MVRVSPLAGIRGMEGPRKNEDLPSMAQQTAERAQNADQPGSANRSGQCPERAWEAIKACQEFSGPEAAHQPPSSNTPLLRGPVQSANHLRTAHLSGRPLASGPPLLSSPAVWRLSGAGRCLSVRQDVKLNKILATATAMSSDLFRKAVSSRPRAIARLPCCGCLDEMISGWPFPTRVRGSQLT